MCKMCILEYTRSVSQNQERFDIHFIYSLYAVRNENKTKNKKEIEKTKPLDMFCIAYALQPFQRDSRDSWRKIQL